GGGPPARAAGRCRPSPWSGESMTETLPVAVVIPTIGRLDRLRACLDSIARCDARASEVLVVDQSLTQDVRDLVVQFESIGARLVPCEGRGIALGTNLGLR